MMLRGLGLGGDGGGVKLGGDRSIGKFFSLLQPVLVVTRRRGEQLLCPCDVGGALSASVSATAIAVLAISSSSSAIVGSSTVGVGCIGAVFGVSVWLSEGWVLG